MRRLLLPFFVSTISIAAFVSLLTVSKAQSPTPLFTNFIPPPRYPCSQTISGEFHPLRPYPGSGCDPLIPRKDPEAPVATNPEKLFLTFKCGKSLNVEGEVTVKDVVNICGMQLLPSNPLSAPLDSTGTSALYRCATNSYDICFVKRIDWDVVFDLSPSELPIIGNSQLPLDDETSANAYLDWYLNGTVQHSEQQALNPNDPDDMRRLSTYAGPLKKLLPQVAQEELRNSLIAVADNDVHNYKTISGRRLQNTPINLYKYIPLASQEDTTGEYHASIASVQPPIDGTILTIDLYINSPSDSRLYFAHMRDVNALSDLLASIHRPRPITPTPALNITDNQVPGQRIIYHQGQPPVPGITDGTVVQIDREYGTSQITRNTEMREGFPAPPELYPPVPPECDITDFRNNPGDSLLGQSINATLTYYQLFRYSPQQVIDCSGGCNLGGSSGGVLCVVQPCVVEGDQCTITEPTQCCTDELRGGIGGAAGNCPWLSECEHADDDYYCVPNPSDCNGQYEDTFPYSCTTRTGGHSNWTCCGPQTAPEYECMAAVPGYQNFCSGLSHSLCTANSAYCDWRRVYSGHNPVPDPPFCPAWPEDALASAARVSTFNKTPLVDKVYYTLVTSNQSVLRRWLHARPTSIPDSDWLKNDKETTLPSSTTVGYTASTSDLENPSYTAGTGGTTGAMYFPYLGSLSDYFLGAPSFENNNLQRHFRPYRPSLGNTAPITGDINCNQTAPTANTACVNRENYIRIAEAWMTTGYPYARECYNDTVLRAQAAGINPGLALLIWLNESDTSNYEAIPDVSDFGMIFSPHNDYSAQIDAFLNHANFIRNVCSAELAIYDPVEVFAARFKSSSCVPYPGANTYAAGLKVKWSWIGGSCPFPFP